MVKREQQPPPRDDAETNRRSDYILRHLANVRAKLKTLPKDERSIATKIAVHLLLLDMDSEARAIFIAMIRTGILFPART